MITSRKKKKINSKKNLELTLLKIHLKGAERKDGDPILFLEIN